MSAFDFRDVSTTAGLALDKLSGAAYYLDDRQMTRSLGSALPIHLADLVSIAMAVYTADRVTSRGAAWDRTFEIRIPAVDLDRWSPAVDALADFLSLLTGDTWAIELVPGRAMRSSETQVGLFPEQLASEDGVGLFSGGLDSLSGAARWLESHPGRLFLVGARSSPVIGADQIRIAADLRALFPGRVHSIGVPLHLVDSVSPEKSQRSRSLLFMALGTAVRAMSGTGHVAVFENGVGAYNPRLDDQQVGSQANRGTHPQVIAAYERVLDAAGIPVRIVLPHRFETKAESMAAMPAAAHPLIALTASCDAYPLRRSDAKQCGRCGSCILRRQSLVAAGLDHLDRTDYAILPLARPVSVGDIERLMARQAWQFETALDVGDWDEAIARWPSLRLDGDMLDQEREAVIDLFRRYGREWADIVARRPALGRSLGWPATVAA